MREKRIFPTSGQLSEAGLRAFLQAFYHWYESAASPAQQCSRARVLFVCLLIRFAALRLGEVLALDDMADIDREEGVVHVRGKWARSLPLPATALKRLLELRDSPCNVRARGGLCRLDPSYVRRIFAGRAEEAGLSGVSPTDIRDFREQELLRHGVPLSTVEFFLGRRGGGLPGPEEAEHLKDAFRQWEYVSRTGRHNIVSGTLTLVRKGELSCLLEVTTRAGTVFAVQCSTRTFARLELIDQKETSLFVRSLQVGVHSQAVAEQNCFAGHVTDLLVRGEEARVMIRLEDDALEFCAILSLAEMGPLHLSPGATVWIQIRPADFTFGGAGEFRH